MTRSYELIYNYCQFTYKAFLKGSLLMRKNGALDSLCILLSGMGYAYIDCDITSRKQFLAYLYPAQVPCLTSAFSERRGSPMSIVAHTETLLLAVSNRSGKHFMENNTAFLKATVKVCGRFEDKLPERLIMF